MEQNSQRRRSYSNEQNTSENQNYDNQRNRSYRNDDNDYENRSRDFQGGGDQYRDYNDYDNRNYGQGYNHNSNINENDRNRNNDYRWKNSYRNEDYNRGSYDRSGGSNYGGYMSRGVYGEGGFGYDPYGNYNRSQDYGRFNQSQDYGRNRDYDDYRNRSNENDRNWWNRTKDEVSSWFGDDDAQRRRERDERNSYKGKGPKDYKRSEERIREDVSDRLCDAYDVDASNIEVKINGSEVTLSGHVNTKNEKRRAEDITEQVSGVTNVQNNLRVGSWSDTPSTTNTSNSTNIGNTSASSR